MQPRHDDNEPIAPLGGRPAPHSPTDARPLDVSTVSAWVEDALISYFTEDDSDGGETNGAPSDSSSLQLAQLIGSLIKETAFNAVRLGYSANIPLAEAPAASGDLLQGAPAVSWTPPVANSAPSTSPIIERPPSLTEPVRPLGRPAPGPASSLAGGTRPATGPRRAVTRITLAVSPIEGFAAADQFLQELGRLDHVAGAAPVDFREGRLTVALDSSYPSAPTLVEALRIDLSAFGASLLTVQDDAVEFALAAPAAQAATPSPAASPAAAAPPAAAAEPEASPAAFAGAPGEREASPFAFSEPPAALSGQPGTATLPIDSSASPEAPAAAPAAAAFWQPLTDAAGSGAPDATVPAIRLAFDDGMPVEWKLLAEMAARTAPQDAAAAPTEDGDSEQGDLWKLLRWPVRPQEPRPVVAAGPSGGRAGVAATEMPAVEQTPQWTQDESPDDSGWWPQDPAATWQAREPAPVEREASATGLRSQGESTTPQTAAPADGEAWFASPGSSDSSQHMLLAALAQEAGAPPAVAGPAAANPAAPEGGAAGVTDADGAGASLGLLSMLGPNAAGASRTDGVDEQLLAWMRNLGAAPATAAWPPRADEAPPAAPPAAAWDASSLMAPESGPVEESAGSGGAPGGPGPAFAVERAAPPAGNGGATDQNPAAERVPAPEAAAEAPLTLRADWPFLADAAADLGLQAETSAAAPFAPPAFDGAATAPETGAGHDRHAAGRWDAAGQWDAAEDAALPAPVYGGPPPLRDEAVWPQSDTPSVPAFGGGAAVAGKGGAAETAGMPGPDPATFIPDETLEEMAAWLGVPHEHVRSASYEQVMTWMRDLAIEPAATPIAAPAPDAAAARSTAWMRDWEDGAETETAPEPASSEVVIPPAPLLDRQESRPGRPETEPEQPAAVMPQRPEPAGLAEPASGQSSPRKSIGLGNDQIAPSTPLSERFRRLQSMAAQDRWAGEPDTLAHVLGDLQERIQTETDGQRRVPVSASRPAAQRRSEARPVIRRDPNAKPTSRAPHPEAPQNGLVNGLLHGIVNLILGEQRKGPRGGRR